MYKSFSLFHTPYSEGIKEFLNDYFFVQNLFYIKRFNSGIVFKFSKNVELMIANDPKIEQNVEWKIENNCHGVKNAEFKFANQMQFLKN